jgi:hypothetical protein
LALLPALAAKLTKAGKQSSKHMGKGSSANQTRLWRMLRPQRRAKSSIERCS